MGKLITICNRCCEPPCLCCLCEQAFPVLPMALSGCKVASYALARHTPVSWNGLAFAPLALLEASILSDVGKLMRCCTNRILSSLNLASLWRMSSGCFRKTHLCPSHQAKGRQMEAVLVFPTNFVHDKPQFVVK